MRPRRRVLRTALRVAGFAGPLVIAHGCVVEFTDREPGATTADAAGFGPGRPGEPSDGGTGSGPARPADATARPSDAGLRETGPPSPTDARQPDPEAMDDADRPEADGAPDAERPADPDDGTPFVDLQIRGGTAPENCGALDLTIEYTALNVGTCVAQLEPADRDGAVAPLLPGRGTHTWPDVLGVAVVTLSCLDATGRPLTDTETRTPVTGLDPQTTVDGRNRVADIQRLCAGLHGTPEERLPGGDGDGAVKNTSVAAARLCACMGYHAAEITEAEDPCFQHEMGRKIADWKHREHRWDIKAAKPMDGCIGRLECTMPAVRCDAWPPL